MSTKTITLAFGASARTETVEIDSNTTAQDILNQFNLDGYKLASGSGQPMFGDDEVIFDQVDEKQKIFATSVADVGFVSDKTERVVL